MHSTLIRATVAALLSLAAMAASAQAVVKPRIERAADLPRFSYKIDGKLEDVVRQAERFAPVAAAIRRDTESVLAGYDIPDRATLRGLVTQIAVLDFLDAQYDRTLARLEQVRALEDKPADKLLVTCRSGGRAAMVTIASANIAPARLTTDSIASDNKPTEPVSHQAPVFSAMVASATATESWR